MLTTFLAHQWKSFWRGRNKAGSIAAQLLIWFFMLYFLSIALFVGFGMTTFITKIFPGEPQVEIFTGFVLYYFLADLAIRFQMQELPTLSVVPYLSLNIRKKEIVRFLNIKSAINFFNVLPLFIFLPFGIMKIGSAYGGVASLLFICGIFGLAFFNNFFILYIKRKSINNLGYFIGLILLIAVLGGLDYLKIISIRHLSTQTFITVLAYPALALIFVAMAIAMYFVNAHYLLNNLYTEELSTRTEKRVSTDYPFLNRFGRVGALAAIELKLILRHKRPRGTLIMGLMFLMYGFFFYKDSLIAKNEFGTMLFAAIFMTGTTILFYGQFMYAWQSAHFDGLMSNKINLKDFIRAKFLLFTISSSAVTILASFYAFISWKLLLLHLAAYLYNIGFGAVIALYFANFNFKRMDITQRANMNWQGVGATQMIFSFPYIILPLLMYLPFGLADLPYWGLVFIGLTGAAMLLSRTFWINLITRKFLQNKYKIAEGFRE